MSSILHKLKKADEESRDTAGESSTTTAPESAAPATPPAATSTTAAPATPPAAPSAPAKPPLGIPPKPAAPAAATTPPPASASATTPPATTSASAIPSAPAKPLGIPPKPAAPAAATTPPATTSTPAIKSPLGGVGIKKPAEVEGDNAAGKPPFAPVDFDDAPESEKAPGRKGAIEASRVFRADGSGEKSSSVGRKVLYSVLGMLLVFGGGYAVVLLEVIPGVSPSSVLNLLGARQEDTSFQTRADTVPELAVASSEDQVVSLPVPKVDIQAEVDFANLRASEEDLLTESGRREYAEKIAIIAGIVSSEDIQRAQDETLPDLFGVVGAEGEGGDEKTDQEVYDEITDVKTAEASRAQKAQIDSRTPYDRLLLENIKIRRADGSVEDKAEQGDSAADSAGASAAKSTEEVVVRASESGKERGRKMLAARNFYEKGSYAAAESEYRALVQERPRSLEALRGLALVAVATGRYQLALSQYVEILKYYPRDPVAIADLANLRGTSESNANELEIALRDALGQTPAADGRLYFSLGNLYAGEGRWRDAQEAYFEAYSGDSRNPDYAYNLAVVLDYLNKPTQAGELYEQALKLAQLKPSGFDKSAVANRVRQLSR